MNKRLLCPERVRRLPAQFSWVDQRLARDRFFEHAPPEAWALYLFLLTVASKGLSYYADSTLCQRLGFTPALLARARSHLLALGLIAYRTPLSQVLALDRPPPASLPPRPTDPDKAHLHLRRRRQHLRGRRTP